MDLPAGPSKLPVRKCLICGADTTSCHLGVDACRACVVFYRRARKRTYACRSNSRRCAVDTIEGGLACKRCRFERFERILKESGAKGLPSTSNNQLDDRESSPDGSPDPSSAASSMDAHSPPVEQMLQSPSVSSAFSPISSNSNKERPLLERCKLYYKLMSNMRRTCELSSRQNAPHPMEMIDEDYPVYPATHNALNGATKIALAAVLEYAKGMFPEFAELTKEEKWNLAVRFYYRYQEMDSCYRAHKMFPDDIEKSFGSYTHYFDHGVIDSFFDGSDIDCANLDEAKKFMHDSIDRLTPPGRTAVARANPDNDEYHAILVILFWFTDGAAIREHIVHIGERYKAAVLQELHAYYREELGLTEYATRVGELFMLISHFEQIMDKDKEHFEICRLLGIFNDNTFMYQLQKE